MKTIHDCRYRQLVARMIAARELHHLTQSELAIALGRPQSYIAKVENFDRRLDIIELFDWLRAIDVSPNLFLSESDWWS